jgi:WD40 repeat protein
MQLHPDNQVAYATSSTATNTGTVLIGMEQNGRNEAFSPLTLRPTNLTNPVHFGIFSYYETTGYYLAADTHIYYFGKLPTSTSKAKLSLNSAIKDAVNLPHNLSIFAVTEDKKVHEITIFGKLNTSTKLLTSIPTTIERSSNGQRIAIGMEDGTVQIRDPNTDAILHTLTARKTSAGPARIQALAFVENDEHTVLVAYDKMVDKWSTTNNTITTLTSAVHTKPIASIAVSPDGTQLATGSQDQNVEIWDLASNTSKGALLQDTQSTTKDGEILQLNWSSDGKTIVAAYTGGTFKFWYGSNCK